MESIVLEPGVKEMLLSDTRDFLRSEKVGLFTTIGCLCSNSITSSGTLTGEFPSDEATSCMEFPDLANLLSFMQLQAPSCSISTSFPFLRHG